MHADLAHQWAAALEATPKEQRGVDFLRAKHPDSDSLPEQYSPLGILAKLVMPFTPKVTWHYHATHACWWLAPLVGSPATTQLVEDIRRHCMLRTLDPAFNNGSMSISTLAAHRMSWEHIAELIRKHHEQL